MRVMKEAVIRGNSISGYKRNGKGFAVSFLLPSIILYTIFLIIPVAASLYFALLRWDGITEARFIGLGNFTNLLFEDRHFMPVVRNTMISMAAGVFIQLPIALVVAYLVYRTTKGLHFFQCIYFIPVVIAAAIIGLMFTMFFNPEFGPINSFLKSIGMESLTKSWLSDPKVVLYSVIIPGIWQYMGYHFVILLAGMQSLSSELTESAIIDGANSVQIFFHIIIPNIKDVIQVCLIICATGAIKTFDIPYIMTQGGPGDSSTFLSIYMYKDAFVDSSLGRGTALAVFMLIFALLATFIINRVFAFINKND